MPAVVIDKILGLDKKTSETDLDLRFATLLKNLSTTKKPGALAKDGAYSDVSSSLVAALPADLSSIVSIEEINLTSPSDQTSYLLYGTDSGGNVRIYFGPYYNGSTFTTGWLELTEHEGPYTIEAGDISAGTDADNLIIDSGNANFSDMSDTDDYYNGWFLVANNNNGTHAGNDLLALRITDYDAAAGSKTFSFKAGGLTGVAAGDKFTLSRTLCFADGVSETGSGSPPRYATFPQIDDIIRWLRRENAVIGMTGNKNQFPSQYQLWYGYINRTFGKTNGVAVDDFFLEMQQLQKPDALAYGGGDLTTGTGSLDAAESYKFHACFVYDGVELGPLADIHLPGPGSVSGDSAYTLAQGRIPFDISYSADSGTSGAAISAHKHEDFPTNYNANLLSRRVTAIRIYLEKVDFYDPTFVVEYIIASSNTADIDCVMDSSGVLEIPSTTFDEEASGNTYLDDAGQTNLRPNFAYGAAISSHFIAAKIRNESGDMVDNHLIASIVDGSGNIAIDTFGASNVINLGFYGSKKITGVHVLGDEGIDQSPKARALVFTDDDYYVLQITSGSSFSFDLDNIGQKEGLFAPDSLTYAEGRLYGVSRNGFRVFTPRGARIIGEGLKPDFDALSDASECIGRYFKKERIVVFHFATDNKTYAIDLLSENLNVFELETADTFLWFAPLRDGGLLAVDSSKIYQIGSGSKQDDGDITPLVRTKRIDARHFGGQLGDEIILTEGIISYQSDTAITFKLYRDNSDTPITFNNLSLPAKTNDEQVRFLFPMGTRAREVEAEVTLSASQASSNTDFKFNGMKLFGYTKRRLN